MLRHVLTGSILIAGASAGPSVAFAQTSAPGAAKPDGVPALPVSPAFAVQPEATEITAIQGRGTACAAPGDDLTSTGRTFARCAFDDIGQAFTVNLRHQTETASFHTYGSFSRSATGIFSARRQLYARRPGLSRESSIGLVGIKGELLDKRLRFEVRRAWSEDRLAPVYGGSLARPLDDSGGGSTTFKLEADLIKTPNLRWQLTGELSKTSEDFVTGNVMTVPDLFAIPGDRVQITNMLRLGSTGLKLSFEDMQAYYGSYRSLRFGVDRKGISLRVSKRNSSSDFTFGSEISSSRSDKLQAYLDIEMTTLFPSLIGSSGGLKQLIPYMVSLGWDKGTSRSGYAGFNQSYEKRGWEFTGAWETRLGETSLTYRRDARDQIAPVPGRRNYSYTDLSHSIRRGAWRLGAMVSISRETRPGIQGFEEKMVSFGPSLTYYKRNGPEFSLSIGRDNIASASGGGIYRYNMGSTAISAKLDLTKFLRKRLERQDIALKLEYRKRVDSMREEYLLFDEDLFEHLARTQREGLLLTFSTKL